MNRDYPGYLAESRRSAQLAHSETDLAVFDAAEKGFRASGPQGMLESMLSEQKKLFQAGRLTAYRLAETYAMSGDNKDVIAYLRVARERHESALAGVRNDPTLATLHADPSYREFVSQLGLPGSAGS